MNTEQQRGFSLIEIAIVLVIIGLILGTVLKAVTALQSSGKISATRSTLVTIKQALQRFYAANGRLPCPANPQLADSNANQGLEMLNTAPNPNINNVCNLPGAAFTLGNATIATRAFRGTLPWRTLGLTRDAAEDGYFQQLDYIVSAGALYYNDGTGHVIQPGTPQSAGIAGNLTVNALNGNELTTNTQKAIVILLSHGQNVYGAWTWLGVQTPQDTSNSGAGETENIDNDTTFVIDAVGPSQQPGAYDDIGTWMTAGEVMQLALQSGSSPNLQGTLRNQFEAIGNALFPGRTLSTATVISPATAANMNSCATGGWQNATSITSLLPSATIDPWGTAIQYKLNAGNFRVLVRASGSDRQSNTPAQQADDTAYCLQY